MERGIRADCSVVHDRLLVLLNVRTHLFQTSQAQCFKECVKIIHVVCQNTLDDWWITFLHRYGELGAWNEGTMCWSIILILILTATSAPLALNVYL